MLDYKHWLTSKAVWTAILGVLLQVLGALKIDALSNLDVGVAADQLVNLASAVMFILSAIFRIKATAKLTA